MRQLADAYLLPLSAAVSFSGSRRFTARFDIVLAIILANCLLATTTVADEQMSIGINLNRIADYNPSWVFNDTVRQSRVWISFAYDTTTKSEKWNAGGPVDVDALGMPKSLRRWTGDDGHLMQQHVGTLMFREIGDAFPGGIYRAEWKGDAQIEFGLAARIVKQGTAGDTHWANVEVVPNHSGILLKIVSINPADPLRELHLWMPDHNGTKIVRKPWELGDAHSPFHPLFKERLRPFSTLRFVDWTSTNWTTAHTWEERTTTKHVRQSGDKNGKGVALEYVVALANELEKDVWINCPPWADDDYVRKMAEFFRDHLSPKQKIYVEWANELWNFAPGFATFPWLKQQTQLPQNQGKSTWEVAGFHIKNDLQIWAQVFEGQSDRIVRVVAGQSANPWIAKELVKHVKIRNIDAVSCAAYVSLTEDQRKSFDASTTAADIINAGRTNIRSRNIPELTAHKQLTDLCSKLAGRPIKLVAYEAGQHFDARGKNLPYLDAMYAAQTHPEMERMYDELLKVAQLKGVTLLNHYAYVGRDSPHGSWARLKPARSTDEDSAEVSCTFEAFAEQQQMTSRRNKL